ncbi:MAG: hypothetical protein AB7G17_09325 [Phycisphaerales bacterium]
MKMVCRSSAGACVVALGAWMGGACAGQSMTPPFDVNYVLTDLGGVPGVPGPYGGLTLDPNDPNRLLIGGLANQNGAGIYAIEVERTCDRITGFVGTAERIADAPNIDGGLVAHPSGVLFFTRYSMNELGQIRPGSAMMDKTTALGPLGVSASVGTCQIVPPGLPGAGQLKVISYNASAWYTLTLVPDGTGLFDVTGASGATAIQGGPEGTVYVRAGSPNFPAASVLVSEWAAGLVSTYEVDANGDPVPATRREFVSGLSGAEGAHVDSSTGDFLFSTFGGGDRVIVVRGFNAPCPGDANNDQRVNFTDLNLVLGFFGQSAPNIPGDVSQDCVVNFLDLNIVLSAFGVDCTAP